MTTELKAILERTMSGFLSKACENDGRPDGLIHPDMALHMANAAEAVWDATFAGQEYAKKESVQ